MSSRSLEKKGVTWDEHTIAEHDKERGTRMKISEPKTPFAYSMEEVREDEIPQLKLTESAAAMHEEIVERCHGISDESGMETNSEANFSEAPTEEDEDAAERHRKFEMMRKKHYNMKEALKHSPVVSDEDEEEEEEEPREKKESSRMSES